MPRWTAEARQKQSDIQKTRQSWKHSTGPKSAAGKARSRMNAWKHGLDSESTLTLRRLLRRNAHFLRTLNAAITLIQRQRRLLRVSTPSPVIPNVCAAEDRILGDRAWQRSLAYVRDDDAGVMPPKLPFPSLSYPAIKAVCFP